MDFVVCFVLSAVLAFGSFSQEEVVQEFQTYDTVIVSESYGSTGSSVRRLPFRRNLIYASSGSSAVSYGSTGTSYRTPVRSAIGQGSTGSSFRTPVRSFLFGR